MIRVNDKEIKNPGSVEKLIKNYKLKQNFCVILNGKIIKKEFFKKHKLKDGDNVEIVGFVGGG